MLNLDNVILWTTTIVLLITGGLIVLSLVRLQRQSPPGQPPAGKSHSALDLIWTLIPIGILVLLLVLTYQAVSSTDDAASHPTTAPVARQ